MNNKDFISVLSAKTGYSSKEASQMAMDIVGTFEVKKKLERVLVNPATKQRMLVPPKMVVSFKPNTGLKDKVNGK